MVMMFMQELWSCTDNNRVTGAKLRPCKNQLALEWDRSFDKAMGNTHNMYMYSSRKV